MSDSIKIILFSLLLIGCGGSATTTKPESSQGDMVSQNIELMDLRSSVIILQSEIIDLKENLKIAEDLNKNLQDKIENKNMRLSALEDYPNTYKTKTSDFTTSSTTGQESESVEDLYKTALAFYFESNYEKSLVEFERLINIDDSHELSDNAQYWIGESYFGLGNFRRALSAFEIVLTYPQSNKNDYAQFKIGLCLLKLKQERQAIAAFQSFLDSYPESELVGRVIELRDRIQ